MNKLGISDTLKASAVQAAADIAKKHYRILKALLVSTQDPIVLKAQGMASAKRLERALRQSRVFLGDKKIGELGVAGFRLSSKPDRYRGLLKEFKRRTSEE